MMDVELLSCSIGVTSGFAIALSFIYGLEYVAEYLESLPDSGGTYEAVPSQKPERVITFPEGMDPEDLTDPGMLQYDVVPNLEHPFDVNNGCIISIDNSKCAYGNIPGYY
jgi:hypothetical protein